MNTNKNGKILVKRDRTFSNLVMATDVTEYAELVTVTPPTLPVSVYTNEIVTKLQAAGYNFIARDMQTPTAFKARFHKSWLKKANLSDEVRYALAMQVPTEFDDRWLCGQAVTGLRKKSGIGRYACGIQELIDVNVGLWR